MSREYETIKQFYGDRRAERSQVPLMDHINEGLRLLASLGASDKAHNAFCLHPIVQNDEDVDVSWSEAYPLALEYKAKANAYLCRPGTDHILGTIQLSQILGEMSLDCAHMLWADKIQNQFDFRQYHLGSHPRSKQLDWYFRVWIKYLEDYHLKGTF